MSDCTSLSSTQLVSLQWSTVQEVHIFDGIRTVQSRSHFALKQDGCLLRFLISSYAAAITATYICPAYRICRSHDGASLRRNRVADGRPHDLCDFGFVPPPASSLSLDLCPSLSALGRRPCSLCLDACLQLGRQSDLTVPAQHLELPLRAAPWKQELRYGMLVALAKSRSFRGGCVSAVEEKAADHCAREMVHVPAEGASCWLQPTLPKKTLLISEVILSYVQLRAYLNVVLIMQWYISQPCSLLTSQ